ncbi:nitrite reductase [Gloeophyllum trabeum ATCC 11539]|uniref:Nitrite reductase [NAD(P)H] n=1 Tax=Gloeophyllum trabeum (strain ATCC 11539 / FP-39264 / Madison 617) TaxID=670483 RepID=S7RG17_GLOTA|nr:nitrite reductase [Gloeophyllum trabeum ATCC 11539]EPQ53160.1 nitrite reductase [Gloeophyllum trabeum ATCC 11539]
MEETEAPQPRQTIFVAGLGMVAFIEKLLNLDEAMHYQIHRSIEKLYLNQADWYAKQDPSRFMFYTGEQVTTLDPATHTVTTDKGRKIHYDSCVLATGSVSTLPPYIPPERAAKVQGVFVYRNISDLDAILAYADKDGIKGGRAVVVGGGLLGLEAAKAVYDLETIAKVSIINRQAYPLSRQLDKDGGEIVLRRIENMGVEVLTNTTVHDIITTDDGTFTGLELTDGHILEAQLVIYAIGITPRDDLGRTAGLKCHDRGGIVVDDSLRTSAEDVYAIGECASWRGNTYGLIAPGVEMADILSFNFTQTETSIGGFQARKMNAPDLSTKLKLMGVDVASFGDFFADKSIDRQRAKQSTARIQEDRTGTSNSTHKGATVTIIQTGAETPSDKPVDTGASLPKSNHAKRKQDALEGPIECLSYRDPFSFVYKKYIFSADGKYLLGGMMVGDTSDYVKLVALVKKKASSAMFPGTCVERKGDDEGQDLDDDTQICSCHNVLKSTIAICIRDGVDTLADLKAKTKVGTGCGGCMPLVTNIFKAEMKKAGHALNNHLCPHFAMSRQELFTIIKLRRLKTFTAIMESAGVNKDSLGCEVCKPTIGSILSSLFNEHVMNPVHHANQDTNDRYVTKHISKGTFSVIPRVAAGEITPEKLIALGQVAKKYNLYTKITGGQRIDLFGAQKQDLPDIWEELIAAGFESGHAYGKALRTVKSCVGTTWCRYGIGDSVGLAIQLEERYKGIRSPHKIKGGVSGCVRECAEAQSKDFGLIATDKGWNIFLAGNGGSNPRHATLFATDVPPSRVIRIIDRFLMYYIRTADKLMRTARWVEQFEGGVERLKKILLDDELSICAELEKEMDELVGTYYDEWAAVVKDPSRRKQFRQFVNTDESRPQIEMVQERNQRRPADWPKTFPPAKLRTSSIRSPKSQWQWREVAAVEDLMPTDAGTTSAAVKYGDTQLAIFHIPKRGYFATQQMCPHKRAFVLDHGIVGDDPNGNMYISCPLHKRNYSLTDGECLNDDNYSIMAFDVKEENSRLFLLLPEADELDAVIGTSKWMVRKATAEVIERGGGDGLEIADVREMPAEEASTQSGCAGSTCGGGKALEW